MTLASVAVVAVLAGATPLLGRLVPRGVVPVVVVEILLGLITGPNGLRWFTVDAALDTLALLGVAFLFFLAGLEVDLRALRGALLARAVLAYAVGLGVAVGCAAALGRAGLVQAPWLVGVAFSATGLGLVIPILLTAGLLHTERGRTLVAAASVGEFAAVVVLALSAGAESSQGASLLLLALLAAAAIVVTVVGRRLEAVRPVRGAVGRLSGGTAQLRVRLSVALVIVFAALAQAGLLARGVAAAVFRRGRVDTTTGASALLFATSLPFVVTAGQVGVSSGRLGPATAAAMTTAALVGVCVFPAAGVALLRRAAEHVAPAEPRPRVRPGR